MIEKNGGCDHMAVRELPAFFGHYLTYFTVPCPRMRPVSPLLPLITRYLTFYNSNFSWSTQGR
jgi:hypothetical protein